MSTNAMASSSPVPNAHASSPSTWVKSKSTKTSSPTPLNARAPWGPIRCVRRNGATATTKRRSTLHAKRVIDALHDLSLRIPFDRLIVAGTPKATAQIERLLPRRLQGKLVRTITMPVTASTKDVLAGILKVQERMERDQESSIVEGVLAELHDRGKAVAGFAAVLDAVNQGRVWTLVYGKTFTTSAGECGDCKAYSPHSSGPCVYCGGDVSPLSQPVDRLSQSVLEMGGRVEVVDGPARTALAKKGDIAALLRY